MSDDLTSEAEHGLIKAVRAADIGNFVLTITCEERRWHVRHADAGKVKNGYGISFDEAWNDMMIPPLPPDEQNNQRALRAALVTRVSIQ
jgi:hypothetical protein